MLLNYLYMIMDSLRFEVGGFVSVSHQSESTGCEHIVMMYRRAATDLYP